MNAAMAAHSNVLLMGCYAPSTVSKYTAAVNRFASWCDAMGLLPTTYKQLDHALSHYFVDLWFAKASKVEATCTLYGWDMLLPGIKDRLIRARRSIRGYNRLQPSSPHPPMPWTVCVALAIWLTMKGRFSMAVGVLLSFDCYLRVNELLHLVREDFATGSGTRLGMNDDDHRICLNLRRTKTGEYKGVMIRDENVMVLVTLLLKRTQPGQHVFAFHESTYRRWFHRGIVALGVSLDYVPHSLRHGGATRDYHNGMSMADVMQRGRWAVSKSAAHYIQQGRQLMMMRHVPPFVDHFGRVAGRHLAISLLLSTTLSQNTHVSVG